MAEGGGCQFELGTVMEGSEQTTQSNSHENLTSWINTCILQKERGKIGRGGCFLLRKLINSRDGISTLSQKVSHLGLLLGLDMYLIVLKAAQLPLFIFQRYYKEFAFARETCF